MAKRDNHYEAALEAYLRWLAIPYVAVDETRRTLAGDQSLKSLDFIVSPPAAAGSLLIDVKGRRFPTAGKQYWRNWTTRSELASLAAWEELLGPAATGHLVFAYNVVGDRAPLPPEELFVFRGSLYGFIAIRLDHYSTFATQLSARWDTVSIPTAQFRALARPLRELCCVGLPQGAGAA
ncbi:MAG TPA: HYExAFE family protein [Pirellulaceae bacterium]|nr:HYExAFE family protein [Pirellulaceae bacterium]